MDRGKHRWRKVGRYREGRKKSNRVGWTEAGMDGWKHGCMQGGRDGGKEGCRDRWKKTKMDGMKQGWKKRNEVI